MTSSPPRVSIIIPAYYSDATLEDCLRSLRAQTYRDFEIILINSSPEERTRHIVTSAFPEVRFQQSLTRLYPHAARNHGVSLARGQLLVFTDPDCRARSDWLARLVGACQAGHRVVGGGMELASERWFERGVHLCKFSWALSGLDAAPHWIVPSANVCFERGVWDAVGPLAGDLFCGDALLSWRAAERGYSPWFEPRAVVEHRHQGTLASFWRERLTRGREFGRVRAAFFRWSRARAALHAFLAPWLLLLVMARAGRDAWRGKWGWSYLSTLPVQFIGQLGWCLGEASAEGKGVFAGVRATPDRRGPS